MTPEPPEFIGHYDTCSGIGNKFMQTATLILHITDTTSENVCYVIWGKECEFIQGEKVYLLAERWYGPGHEICKYFLVNDHLKYTIK